MSDESKRKSEERLKREHWEEKTREKMKRRDK